MSQATTQTRARIAAIISEVCGRPAVTAGEHDVALKELGLDSLDVASLFLAIQEQLGIRVPDADIDRLDTVARIAAYLDGSR